MPPASFVRVFLLEGIKGDIWVSKFGEAEWRDQKLVSSDLNLPESFELVSWVLEREEGELVPSFDRVPVINAEPELNGSLRHPVLLIGSVESEACFVAQKLHRVVVIITSNTVELGSLRELLSVLSELNGHVDSIRVQTQHKVLSGALVRDFFSGLDVEISINDRILLEF